MTDSTEILATLVSANFYPESDENDPNREYYNGDTALWIFELPKTVSLGPGIWRLKYERTLAEEEKLGNPVYGLICSKKGYVI
jgi:hypothetical protein